MPSVSTLVMDCDWVCDNVLYTVEECGIASTLETASEYVLCVLETHAWSEPREWIKTVNICAKILFGDMDKKECEDLYLLTASLLKDVMSCVEVDEIKQIEHEGVTYTLTGRFIL